MDKILVADDEQKIREVIKEYAEFNGHEITEAADGMTAVGLCKLNDFDLDHYGYHDAEAGRFFGMQGDQRKQRTFLSSCFPQEGRSTRSSSVSSWVLTTTLSKPFSPKELMARVNAGACQKNSSRRRACCRKIMKFDGLEINIPARTVTRWTATKMDLTPKEYELLFYLVEEQEHRPFQRQAPVRHLGLRLLRRRQDH